MSISSRIRFPWRVNKVSLRIPHQAASLAPACVAYQVPDFTAWAGIILRNTRLIYFCNEDTAGAIRPRKRTGPSNMEKQDATVKELPSP